jgi:hypothetical protein
MTTLAEINDSYKVKNKTRTSPTLSSRQDPEALRIAHITHANRKPIDFGKLREKVSATLEAAKLTSSAVMQLQTKVAAIDELAVGYMNRQLDSLVATLTTLQRKLA